MVYGYLGVFVADLGCFGSSNCDAWRFVGACWQVFLWFTRGLDASR